MTDAFRRIWNAALAAVATIAALDVPARLVLAPGGGPPASEALFTFFFVADLARRLAESLGAAAGPADDGPGRRGRRIAVWAWLAVDLAAALPLASLCGMPGLGLLRLAKLGRVAQEMARQRHRAAGAMPALRFVFFAYRLVLAAHWLACGWMMLRPPEAGATAAGYLEALYWTVQTLSTVGYGDVAPSNAAQMLYAVMVMVFGVGVYGYVIGNVAGLLTRVDPVKTRRRETMQTLEAFMAYRSLPESLRQRIRDYYAYLWDKRLAFDESSLIAALPPGLQVDVALFLKRDIVENVPLFAGAGEAFIREIALQMKPAVFMPGDVVYRKGAASRDMYFITRGRLEVVSPSGSVIAVLKDGDFFGEVGLVLGARRNATVRAITHCDLYMLDHDLFARIAAHHPEIAARLTEEARRRQAE
ncbi:MAG: cyclic nucleotide-binding domain-containing protein [Lentisphaerae bacterium]|nr:cyclic nucleotide-binding domain-containing protein [Lentisphaerota bacterium]